LAFTDDLSRRTTMKKQRSMFMFGIQCVRCNHEIIAPHKSEFLDDKVIRHLWHCPRCVAWFESFPRFPANAKSAKELMTRVDVFPPRVDDRIYNKLIEVAGVDADLMKARQRPSVPSD
jgi:transcription elongation factor Elf1